MVEVITILIFNTAIPKLVPSIVFTILFFTAAIIHLYRLIKTHRRIYLFLFLFGSFRTLAYVTRIIWSQNQDSKVYATLSTCLLTISFFIIFQAIFTLLTDWLKTITTTSSRSSVGNSSITNNNNENINHNNSNVTSNNNNNNNNNDDNNKHFRIPVTNVDLSKISSSLSSSSSSPSIEITNLELRVIKIIKYALPPLFSLIGFLGAIKQFEDTSDGDDDETTTSPNTTDTSSSSSLLFKKYTINKDSDDISNILHRISAIGFFMILLSYMILITYFHLKYSNNRVHKQLKIFILYIIGFLLLIEMIYKLFIAFSSSAYNMDNYTWILYVFESFPELIILFVLGSLILGEWFFISNDKLALIKSFSINSNDDTSNMINQDNQNQNNNLNV